MTYGEDPRRGYFDHEIFIQPEMEFRIDFPSGWRTMNSNEAVVGLDPSQKAILRLSLAEEATAFDAAHSFFADDVVTATGRSADLPSSRAHNFLRFSRRSSTA